MSSISQRNRHFVTACTGQTERTALLPVVQTVYSKTNFNFPSLIMRNVCVLLLRVAQSFLTYIDITSFSAQIIWPVHE
jgi:hypothetical protein